MNTPVNFEIAKLLKEKGFSKSLPSICFIKEESNYTSTMVYEVLDMDFEYILRPTIAEVVMWLYEKHGIWVYADSHEFNKWCYYYRYNRPHELSSKITENGQFGLDDYNSPTEAYSAAVEYTLKNLI